MAAVIRQRAQVFNKPVGVIRTQGGAQQLGQAISSVAGSLTQQAYKVAAEDAQKRGIDVAQSVEEKNLLTFDPETGKPEVFSPPPAFGRIAASAYQDVIDKRFTDSMNSELQLKAKEISLKYQYNPDAYDSVFSDYIGAMSENATGKYKQFIESTGADYLARTKLNIQERVQSRARANLAQSAANSAAQGAENAYELALNGGFILREGEQVSRTEEILTAEVGNVSKAVSTNLLKVGAEKKTLDSISLSTAIGGVEYLISKTKTSAERNALELAIRTRGREVSGIPKELRSALNELLPYIDGGNVSKVLSHASGVSSTYNAVESDEAATMEAVAKQQYIDSVINGGTDENINVQSAVSGFTSNNDEDVLRAVLASNQSYRARQNIFAEQYRSGLISQPEFETGLKDARNDTMRPFLLEAASQGNQETLKVAINNPTASNMEGLTEKQKYFVRAITASPAFNVNEDMKFVTTELSRTKDERKAAIELQRKKYSIVNEVDVAVSNATNGALTLDQISNVRANIEAVVGNGLSATEAASERARFDSALGDGVINRFARTATSTEMSQLRSYIASSGERTTNMSDLVVETGDAVRALTDEGDIESLTGKIASMNIDIIKSEDKAAIVNQRKEDNNLLMAGSLSPNIKANRDFSQDFFDSLGVDLGKFNLLSAEDQRKFFPIIASTPPTGLINKLKDIESGVEVAGAEGYLDLFARLNQDTFSNGMTRSRLGNTLDVTTMENLRDIHRIRMTGNLDQSASEIAINLKNAQTTPAAKLNLDTVLGKQTLGQYTLELTSEDRVVALELTPLVEYLARSGQSKTQINARVAAIIDEKYAPSEFIADPAFPLGTINKSRNSLEAVLPNQAAVDKFVSIVEANLRDGYSLYANKTNAAAAAAVGYANLAQTQEGFDEAMKGSQDLKQVYLVPDPRTSGVGYFVYEVDDTNTLVPHIYDVTPLSRKGEKPKPVPTFPFFDESILADHYAQEAAATEADIREGLDREEELVEKRREMKIQNQFKSFKDVTKAPSLWWEYLKMEREQSVWKGFGG